MESEVIKKLLEKYWQCETTLEEEDQLREYFQADDIDIEFIQYQPMFRYFEHAKSTGLGNDFDKKVLQTIATQKPPSHRFLGWTYKVAAAVLLILTFAVINHRYIVVKEKAAKLVQDTFNDPQKALDETKKALLLVSQKLNKGTEGVTKMSEFNKAEEILKNKNSKKI